MKAPSRTAPVPSLLLIYNSDTLPSLLLSSFNLSFHLLSSRLLPSHVLLSACPHLLLPPCLFRPTAFGSRSHTAPRAVCLCGCVCQAKEQEVICGFTSAALNCVRRLADLFYDCSMKYLTYHCRKVQQTQGFQTSTRRREHIGGNSGALGVKEAEGRSRRFQV